jgi:hypothetical protein
VCAEKLLQPKSRFVLEQNGFFCFPTEQPAKFTGNNNNKGGYALQSSGVCNISYLTLFMLA